MTTVAVGAGLRLTKRPVGPMDNNAYLLTHGNDAHLDTFLISPLGTSRELSTDNPGAGTGVNFTSTIFDDAAVSENLTMR